NIKEDIHVGPLEISQQEIFDQFIEDNKNICALSQTKIGHTTLFQHQIPTGDHEPITSPAYRLKENDESYREAFIATINGVSSFSKYSKDSIDEEIEWYSSSNNSSTNNDNILSDEE
ncbi:4718_t:CDS:2, partial [Funneliformis geosporum]